MLAIDDIAGAKAARLDCPAVCDQWDAPLVSFIITNFNYGRYLERCISSVFAQTYTQIECIVVDDASTDGSRDICAQLKQRFPDAIFILNEENLGQTRSCVRGFERSRGHYVALVDADDYLLPDYAATHIRAHWSLRRHVGFTSCDMLQCIDGEIVLPSGVEGGLVDAMSYRATKSDRQKIPAIAEGLVPPVRKFDLRLVQDAAHAWVWNPTSSSVYRRDILKLFLDNPRIGKLKYSTDAYLNYAINGLCGSALIDRPCAVYNIHGGNNFSRSALLSNFVSFDKEADYGCFAAYCALEHIVLNFRAFATMSHDLRRLLMTMKMLASKTKESRWSLVILQRLSFSLIGYVWKKRLPSLVPFRR